MKIPLFAISVILVSITAFGCSSSGQEDQSESKYPDLVQIHLPEGMQQEESQLYIDSVDEIVYNGSQALFIRGSFPDACTHIRSASHQLRGDTVEIEIKAWRELNTMCTQALTSFSFIYEGIPDSLITTNEGVIINRKPFNIQ